MRHLAVALGLLACGVVLAGEPLLRNGDFARWDGGMPAGWQVSEAAVTGAGAESSILPLEGGGLALRGDMAVGTWRYVHQTFPVAPGTTYHVRFEARSDDLSHGPGQPGNCEIALLMKDADGRELSRQSRNVYDRRWTNGDLFSRAPETAVRGEVRIFLALTGVLQVRSVEVAADPRSSFRVLVEDMARNYPHLDAPAMESLAARYEGQARHALAPSELGAVLESMLAELHDPRIRIDLPGGKRLFPFRPETGGDLDIHQEVSGLRDIRQVSRVWLTGRTREGFGYVGVWSLSAPTAAYDDLERAVVPLMVLPGILVDLRACRGDRVEVAARIAGWFTAEPHPWGRLEHRSEPRDPPPAVQVVVPSEGRRFTRPVMGLIGPGCLGAGEVLVMMMRSLPNVTLVGQPTGGHTGSPEPIELPLGVVVRYPRWGAVLPDGTAVDGRGLEPDVAAAGGGDATYATAMSELARRVE